MSKTRENIKKQIILIILLLAVAGVIFLIINTNLTGRIIQNYSDYSQNPRDHKTYTKAICDENNYCQDYKITCENKKVVDISPITGANIQHSETWEDPRPNKSEITCE